MTRTGVFATKQEMEALRTQLGLPLMKIGGTLPESPQVMCHRMALAHGLPEIEGYYEIDRDGEFLRT